MYMMAVCCLIEGSFDVNVVKIGHFEVWVVVIGQKDIV